MVNQFLGLVMIVPMILLLDWAGDQVNLSPPPLHTPLHCHVQNPQHSHTVEKNLYSRNNGAGYQQRVARALTAAMAVAWVLSSGLVLPVDFPQLFDGRLQHNLPDHRRPALQQVCNKCWRTFHCSPAS